MNFKSDNTSGVSPEILQAITEINTGFSASYGTDDVSKKLKARVAEIFECDVEIYMTSTGTASNNLALSALVSPYGSIFCHKKGHINTDECGGTELFTGSAKVIPIGGDGAKIDLHELEQYILAANAMRPHASKPSVINISQVTEYGTVYTLDELAAIGALAQKYSLGFHMDGARFTNALVALGCSPAAMTWKRGVDILSFGATKNGALMSEMVVIFNKKYAQDFDYRHKRVGQLMSKTRFFAVQFLAYLDNDLWLRNARHANAMAAKLVTELSEYKNTKIMYNVQANEIFATMSSDLVKFLWDNHAHFYHWEDDVYRLVTSWVTTEQEINDFIELLKKFYTK